MSETPKLTEIAKAAKRMMRDLGLQGQIDVEIGGASTTTWIGKPEGCDFLISVTIKPLPPAAG